MHPLCVESVPGQGVLKCLKVEYMGREKNAGINAWLPALDCGCDVTSCCKFPLL